MGMYAYIKGTSFDVINAMDFNFVLDVFDVNQGSGTRDYSSAPACDLTVVPVNVSTSRGSGNELNYSQSANAVSWYSPRPMKMAIMATPKVGANYPGNDFTLQARDSSSGRLKIAPNFTPFCLVEVIDFTPGVGVYQTGVPAGYPVMVFHRGRSNNDRVLYYETTRNGFLALDVRFQQSSIPIRVYIFSNYMKNIPEWGFFMYKNGDLVWHSNCLPLKLNVMKRTSNQSPITVTSTNPLAIQSSVTANRNLRITDAEYSQLYLSSSAGWSQSMNAYVAEMEGYNYIFNIISGYDSIPASWWVPYLGYIETDIYDMYYQQSLGLV